MGEIGMMGGKRVKLLEEENMVGWIVFRVGMFDVWG
jgi:hypothetical protein